MSLSHHRIGALLILACTSTLTLADHTRSYEYADVTHVEPITRVVTTKIPHESCWEEDVQVYPSHGRRSHTPTILGALIGGGIGNALGHHSSNKKVGAVVGAILGASVASDVHRAHTAAKPYTVTRQRCETDYEVREEKKVVGYRISYTYGDKIYQTRRDDHPGDRLKIRVEITPV